MSVSSSWNHSLDCKTATSLVLAQVNLQLGVSVLALERVLEVGVLSTVQELAGDLHDTGSPSRVMVPQTSTILPESWLMTALTSAVVSSTSSFLERQKRQGSCGSRWTRCTSLSKSPSMLRGKMGLVMAFQPTTMAKSIGAIDFLCQDDQRRPLLCCQQRGRSR